jgi:hypothetical protein
VIYSRHACDTVQLRRESRWEWDSHADIQSQEGLRRMEKVAAPTSRSLFCRFCNYMSRDILTGGLGTQSHLPLLSDLGYMRGRRGVGALVVHEVQTAAISH